jgi:phosphoribosylformylglycinamidine cyclo-ligase
VAVRRRAGRARGRHPRRALLSIAVSTDAYARSGVDQNAADRAVSALVGVLRTIDTGRASRSVLASGHYAAVLEIAPNLGIAVGTDGVGSKLIVAERMGRYETVGIDCVAMNVNDIICVGAEPIALLDYLAVEQADPDVLAAIGTGLKAGAEQAGVEIPGGEVAILPELIRGHPSPHGFDLTATCFGTVALDALVTGERIAPGDALIGLPSSGLHSNSYSLARQALPDLDEPFAEGTVGEALLAPTVIYVRAVLELLRSEIPVHGLAHITGGGVRNLLRLTESAGFAIEDPLPNAPIIDLVIERAGVSPHEAWEVFNMGCGFVAVVPAAHADQATAILAARHPGSRRIGTVTPDPGVTVAGLSYR